MPKYQRHWLSWRFLPFWYSPLNFKAFLAFSSILIFSTKPSTKNSIWSLASSGKWVNLDIWYLMDIWRTLGQICGWVGEIFGAERTTVVSCETRFRLEIGTWPMFTAECSDTISRAIGNLGGQIVPKKNARNPNSLLLHWTQLELDLNFLLGLANYKTKQ